MTSVETTRSCIRLHPSPVWREAGGEVMSLVMLISICLLLTAWISSGSTISPGKAWNISTLNTAGDAEYLSPAEKGVILEINKLRSDPAAYAAEYLEPLVHRYQGQLLHLPGNTRVKTMEGVIALMDAIRFLKKTPPVPLLTPDHRLTLASRDHQKDQSVKGGTGHNGSDGSGAQSRIRKYGRYSRAVGENIFYGEEYPRWVVLHLVIDDGMPQRGHRLNLLDRDYGIIGVAMGHHPRWKYVCVMDFADVLK